MKSRAFVAFLGALVLGCADESFTPPAPVIPPPAEPALAVDDPSLVGTWKLRTIGGDPLPYWVGDRQRQQNDGYKIEVTEEIIVVIPPSRFITTHTGTNTDHGQVRPWTYADTGTYKPTARGLLLFDNEGDEPDQASITGMTMTKGLPSFVNVYDKQ